MDFELDDEQKLLRDTTRDVLTKAYDAEKRNAVIATERGWNPQVWSQLANLGLLGLPFSEDDGGMGAGPVEISAVMTEIGRRLAPEPVLDAVLVPGGLVADAASAEQRSKILPALASGEKLMAFAHTESGVRWPSSKNSTAASRDETGGNGSGWVLTGVKNPVLHGGDAATFVVSAALPEGGTGLFLVDKDADGVEVDSYATHDGLRGAQVSLRNASAEPLGEGGDASAVIEVGEIRTHAALCAEAIGAMEEALRLTTEYLKARKQFGVPIAKFQTLTHRAADLYVLLELARSMSLYATLSLAAGKRDRVVASRARLQISRSARKIGQEAIQMHGGIGMTDEYPVGHYVSRLTAIEHTLGGGDDHLRVLASVASEPVQLL